MKQTSSITRTLLTALALLGLQSGLQAQTSNDFRVNLNTLNLASHPDNPFSVYYDLTNGSGADNGARVTLNNFSFGAGGSWSGPSSVTLLETAGGFDASFIRAFTPGDLLSFDVHLASLSDDTPPDVFTFALMDANGFFLATTGSDPNNPDGVGADVYLSVPFVNGATLADIQIHNAFTGDPSNGGINSGQISVGAIPTSTTPEGGSASLLLSGLGVAAFFARRRRSTQVA
jgi:MYXO-CTERM domain-containing protein